MSETKTPPPSKQAAKRQATERRILKAFERLLKRKGSNQLGINALVEEAEVGKGLIYEYFGGLEGVAKAWGAQSDFALSEEDILGGEREAFLEKSTARQIADVHVNYANMLRRSPVALQLLAEELNTPDKLSKHFSAIRGQIGSTHEKVFTEIAPLADEDDMALCFIFLAASNYLALRATTSPNYNGIELNTDEGWNSVMSMFQRIANKVDQPSSDKPLPGSKQVVAP